MSSEEQDRILGRVLREHGEAKAKLAALHAEAERLGSYFNELSAALRKNHSLDFRWVSAGQPGSTALNDYPSKADLEQLAEDIREVTDARNALAARLRAAGYEVKD